MAIGTGKDIKSEKCLKYTGLHRILNIRYLPHVFLQKSKTQENMQKATEIHSIGTLFSNMAIVTVTNIKSPKRLKYTGFPLYSCHQGCIHMFSDNNLEKKINMQKVPHIHCLSTLSTNMSIVTVINVKSEKLLKSTGFPLFSWRWGRIHMVSKNNLKMKTNMQKVPQIHRLCTLFTNMARGTVNTVKSENRLKYTDLQTIVIIKCLFTCFPTIISNSTKHAKAEGNTLFWHIIYNNGHSNRH